MPGLRTCRILQRHQPSSEVLLSEQLGSPSEQHNLLLPLLRKLLGPTSSALTQPLQWAPRRTRGGHHRKAGACSLNSPRTSWKTECSIKSCPNTMSRGCRIISFPEENARLIPLEPENTSNKAGRFSNSAGLTLRFLMSCCSSLLKEKKTCRSLRSALFSTPCRRSAPSRHRCRASRPPSGSSGTSRDLRAPAGTCRTDGCDWHSPS